MEHLVSVIFDLGVNETFTQGIDCVKNYVLCIINIFYTGKYH